MNKNSMGVKSIPRILKAQRVGPWEPLTNWGLVLAKYGSFMTSSEDFKEILTSKKRTIKVVIRV